MCRKLLKAVVGFAFVVVLVVASPALAQERLFLYQYPQNTLSELETEESSLGRTRRSVQLR
jgi:hypothetical protein